MSPEGEPVVYRYRSGRHQGQRSERRRGSPAAHVLPGARLRRPPGALAAAGVAPADITAVFLTHLHADHIGWVAPGGVLFFPNAVVMCSAVEWETPPVAPAPGELEGRRGLAVARAAGVLRLLNAATVSSMTRASRSFPRPSPRTHCGHARNSSRPCRGATCPSA
ncbi:MAG TPA: MBL fold metallo-hydrolase [Streptosporangiaceae bacterium]|nr:MBL fold metallo-hydrolase [Streptosporangiaceae bacterium]